MIRVALAVLAALAVAPTVLAGAHSNEQLARQHFVQAETDYASGDLLTAYVEWQQALLLKPSSVETEKRLDEAGQKMLVGGGMLGLVHYQFAEMHIGLGDLESARTELQLAHKVFPTSRCIKQRLAELESKTRQGTPASAVEPEAKANVVAYQTVRAQRFELVDSQGNIKGAFKTLPDGSPSIVLADSAGRVAVEASVMKDGPGIKLRDPAGNTVLCAAVVKDTPAIMLFDSAGNPAITATLLKGRPFITVGCAGVQMTIRQESKGEASLSCTDSAGSPRLSLGITKDGPFIGVWEANGTPLWYSPWLSGR